MIEKFRKHLKECSKSQNTIDTYIGKIRQYYKWYNGSFGASPPMLYRANILDYISYLHNIKKCKGKTLNNHLAALTSFNLFLIENKVQEEIVITKRDYRKIQLNYASPSTVSKQEVEALRQQVLVNQGKRDYAIVTIMAYGGLRISEVLGLNLSSINLTSREMVVKGKGNKERLVFINDKIVNSVSEYLKERKSESTLLFVSRQGGQIHRSVINKIFNTYSDHITPHTLRHFFCSSAIEAGYSIAEVASQAGHSNIQTSLLYLNPTREQMKEKSNRL